jgi:hypothetical protein
MSFCLMHKSGVCLPDSVRNAVGKCDCLIGFRIHVRRPFVDRLDQPNLVDPEGIDQVCFDVFADLLVLVLYIQHVKQARPCGQRSIRLIKKAKSRTSVPPAASTSMQ